ncbi:hypothetical protein RclHR1_04450011 [Rhizophagus clarus]|uniref:Uncharacterized protein n=1 Tax=Rhizophagus clarus TaxID=94130 RepID=A0A2Z6RMH0_9GLOM|nr:hypothetical protein RclHR1_04450011 [Rhizophagus clarus]
MNVELQAIVNRITASILYDNVITNLNSYKIREILYKHSGHWKMRHVKYSYQHPSEFAALEEPRTFLLIYKLFIDLYYDDFGTFHNVYNLLGGVYIQIGNMPLTERHRLKNHFVLGFVPFGGSFDEFIKPFITKMKILEKGKIMSIQENECVVIASLSITTASLPQGNNMVGIKHHGANKGCQTCNMTKAFLTSNNFDLQLVSHYHYQSDKQFEQIYAAQIITEHKVIAAEYELWLNPQIFNQLKREKHLQSSQDIYHLTARKMLRFLKITIEALSPEGKIKFIAVWKSFEYLKNSELELFQHRTGVTQSDHAVKLLLKCWIVMAKMMAIVFKDSFTEEEYDELRECLYNEQLLLSQRMMSNWFVTKDNADIKDDADEAHMVLKVFSPDERISNILLKKRVPQRNVELSLLMNFHEELKLVYEDFGDSPVILNNTPSFFEYVSFVFEKKEAVLFYAVYILVILY